VPQEGKDFIMDSVAQVNITHYEEKKKGRLSLIKQPLAYSLGTAKYYFPRGREKREET
jgi:hypothetical protein